MRLIIVSLLAFSLAGCLGEKPKPDPVVVTVERHLPRPDARLTSKTFCGDPIARPGDDAKEGWAAEDRARACEAARVAAWAAFYGRAR